MPLPASSTALSYIVWSLHIEQSCCHQEVLLLLSNLAAIGWSCHPFEVLLPLSSFAMACSSPTLAVLLLTSNSSEMQKLTYLSRHRLFYLTLVISSSSYNILHDKLGMFMLHLEGKCQNESLSLPDYESKGLASKGTLAPLEMYLFFSHDQLRPWKLTLLFTASLSMY